MQHLHQAACLLVQEKLEETERHKEQVYESEKPCRGEEDPLCMFFSH